MGEVSKCLKTLSDMGFDPRCMCFPQKGILNLELWKHIHLGSNPMSPNVFPGGSVVENPPANAGDGGSISGSARCPGEENREPAPVFLPRESRGPRGLAGYSP